MNLRACPCWREEALGRTEVTNGENSFIKAVRWNTVRQQRAVWALEGKQWHEERGILAPQPLKLYAGRTSGQRMDVEIHIGIYTS